MAHIQVTPKDLRPVKLEFSEYAATMILGAIRRVEKEFPNSETSFYLNWLGTALDRYGLAEIRLPKSEADYLHRKNI